MAADELMKRSWRGVDSSPSRLCQTGSHYHDQHNVESRMSSLRRIIPSQGICALIASRPTPPLTISPRGTEHSTGPVPASPVLHAEATQRATVTEAAYGRPTNVEGRFMELRGRLGHHLQKKTWPVPIEVPRPRPFPRLPGYTDP